MTAYPYLFCVALVAMAIVGCGYTQPTKSIITQPAANPTDGVPADGFFEEEIGNGLDIFGQPNNTNHNLPGMQSFFLRHYHEELPECPTVSRTTSSGQKMVGFVMDLAGSGECRPPLGKNVKP